MTDNFHARYLVEHELLPKALYTNSALLQKLLLSEPSCIMREFYAEAELTCPGSVYSYSEHGFSADMHTFSQEQSQVLIVRLGMPAPEVPPLCRAVYMCFASLAQYNRFYTSELYETGEYFLCGWDKGGIHSSYGIAAEDEFSEVARLFWSSADAAYEQLSMYESCEDEEDEDFNEEEIDPPKYNGNFILLYDSIKSGFDKYFAAHPLPVLEAFRTALYSDLDRFAAGEEISDYDFTVSVRNKSDISYIDFKFEEDLIEVSKGGSVYDPDVADSFTDWEFSIWRNGDSDMDYYMSDEFESIVSLLSDSKAEFSIDTPDKYFYSSKSEDDDLLS